MRRWREENLVTGPQATAPFDGRSGWIRARLSQRQSPVRFCTDLHRMTWASLMAPWKKSTCQCRRCKRCRFDPWIGKIPWRRNGNPLQYSCLEKSMDNRLQSLRSQRVGYDWAAEHHHHYHTAVIVLVIPHVCVFGYISNTQIDCRHKKYQQCISRMKNVKNGSFLSLHWPPFHSPT